MTQPIEERFQKIGGKPIGSGGMGEVWRVYDKKTGAVFALKQLRPHLVRDKDRRRFSREIKNLKKINHPNVVKIIDGFPDNDPPAYLMEYCPDGSLHDWLATPHTDGEKLGLFEPLLDGLLTIHTHCLHRDIKPGNILLGQDGQFKLSDFGLSIAFEDHQRITTSNWYSPGFSPPEQVIDMATVSKAGDMYAIGAVFYYILTGKDCSSSPQLQSDRIPSFIKPLLSWMLEGDQKLRCSSADDAIEVLQILHSNSDIVKDDNIGSCPECNAPMWLGYYDRYEEEDYDKCMVCGYRQLLEVKFE